jgi:hypothetical protein
MTAAVAHPHCHSGVCAPPKKVEEQSEEWRTFLRVVEIVSLLGLSAFAAYTDWRLFVPFAAGGMLLGFYIELNAIHNAINTDDPGYGLTCTQSTYQQMTRLPLPAMCTHVINVATAVSHIIDRHCRPIFIPIAAVNFGAWFGAMIIRTGHFIYKEMQATNGFTKLS